MKTNVPGKDSLVCYFADIKSVGLLSQQEEMIAFRQIEAAETALFQNVLSNKSFSQKYLPDFEESVKQEAAYEPNKASIKAVIVGSRSPVDMHAFMHVMRFTESGREWMQGFFADAAKLTGTRTWSKKTNRLSKELQRLRNKFAAANLRLVIKIAKTYWRVPMSQSLGDLIQEGNLGLMKAIERFDLDRGYKFSTYAMWWIRHYVKRSIADKDPLVRIPSHLTDRIHQIARAEAKHYTLTGQNLSENELGEVIGHSVKKIRHALVNRRRTVASLDSTMGDTDVTLMETISDPGVVSPLDATDHKKMSYDIRELLTALSPNESRIIRWRFGLDDEVPLTLQQIADKFGLTRERIRQIEFKALGKLRIRPRAREYKAAMFKEAG